MKASNNAKKAVESHLQEVAAKDNLFAETLKKPSKNIEGCMNYIMSQAKKSGANMMTDEEVFQMAIHYFDEDSIKDPGKVAGIINHSGGDPKSAALATVPAAAAKAKKKDKVSSHQTSLF